MTVGNIYRSGKIFTVWAIAALASVVWSGAAAAQVPASEGEAQFSRLFETWQKAKSASRSTVARSATTRVPPRHYAHPESGGKVGGVVVSSRMGMRMNPVVGRVMFHAGADLAAPQGSPVRATATGVVERAGWSGGYGLLVALHHQDGYETRYAHLSQVSVETGQVIEKGQVIGFVGSTGRSTGPHLHYEVRRNGQVLDPLLFIRR